MDHAVSSAIRVTRNSKEDFHDDEKMKSSKQFGEGWDQEQNESLLWPTIWEILKLVDKRIDRTVKIKCRLFYFIFRSLFIFFNLDVEF